MRRVTLVLAVFVLVSLFSCARAHADAVHECRHRATTPYSVKNLIRCAAPKMGVSTSHALYIAYRESHYYPWARNPRSSASGVYQVVSGTWRTFVSRYRWGSLVGSNVFNGRANVFLSLRAARHGGWGPWGG